MTSTRTTTIPLSGPYDLGEVARMGFGHRDEPEFDGVAYAALCARDPVLARVHAAAPGFRPALFHSAYEALVWAVLSAGGPASRRSRSGRGWGSSWARRSTWRDDRRWPCPRRPGCES